MMWCSGVLHPSAKPTYLKNAGSVSTKAITVACRWKLLVVWSDFCVFLLLLGSETVELVAQFLGTDFWKPEAIDLGTAPTPSPHGPGRKTAVPTPGKPRGNVPARSARCGGRFLP